MSHTEGTITLHHRSLPSAALLFADQAGWREPQSSGQMLKCLLLLGHDISPRQKSLVCGAHLGLVGSCLFTGHGMEDTSEAKSHVHKLDTAQETAGRRLMPHSYSEQCPWGLQPAPCNCTDLIFREEERKKQSWGKNK